MGTVLLVIVLALSIVDVLSYSFHFGSMTLLLAVLKIQADISARRLLSEKNQVESFKDSFKERWLRTHPMETAPPPRKPRKAKLLLISAAKTEKHEEKKPQPAEHFEKKRAEPQKPPAKKQERFSTPKFHGRPHEVLGIPEQAVTQVILKAFRHWIKVHHPDHAILPTDKKHATAHARSLAEAKNTLLEQRKRIRARAS